MIRLHLLILLVISSEIYAIFLTSYYSHRFRFIWYCHFRYCLIFGMYVQFQWDIFHIFTSSKEISIDFTCKHMAFSLLLIIFTLSEIDPFNEKKFNFYVTMYTNDKRKKTFSMSLKSQKYLALSTLFFSSWNYRLNRMKIIYSCPRWISYILPEFSGRIFSSTHSVKIITRFIKQYFTIDIFPYVYTNI
jgi:hypothetical protein